MPDEKPVQRPGRDVSDKTRLFLYVRAGGRCEFDGCPRYLLEHYPTFMPGIFAQMAHIWAFSPDGPRGHEGIGPADLNHISNLILLCHPCHRLVDEHPDRYPVTVLREFKRAHEDRVFMLTGINPGRHTVALRMTANIGNHAVEISHAEMQMQAAVAPRYFSPREVVDVDLTTIADQGLPRSRSGRTDPRRVRGLDSTPGRLPERTSHRTRNRRADSLDAGPARRLHWKLLRSPS